MADAAYLQTTLFELERSVIHGEVLNALQRAVEIELEHANFVTRLSSSPFPVSLDDLSRTVRAMVRRPASRAKPSDRSSS